LTWFRNESTADLKRKLRNVNIERNYEKAWWIW